MSTDTSEQPDQKHETCSKVSQSDSTLPRESNEVISTGGSNGESEDQYTRKLLDLLRRASSDATREATENSMADGESSRSNAPSARSTGRSWASTLTPVKEEEEDDEANQAHSRDGCESGGGIERGV